MYLYLIASHSSEMITLIWINPGLSPFEIPDQRAPKVKSKRRPRINSVFVLIGSNMFLIKIRFAYNNILRRKGLGQ